MSKTVLVDARWVSEDQVWIATSQDVPGFVIEGATWSEMIRETQLILPDMFDLAGLAEPSEVIFKAEQRLTLAAA